MRVFGGGAACRMTATTCHSKHPIWKTWVKKLYTVETQQEPEYGSDGGTTYTKSFHSLEISEMCFQNTKKVREKVFTTLTIKLPESDSSQCALWLKIDSGANGNVPPLRKLKQMYGEDALVTCKQIKPTPGLSMTSYNDPPMQIQIISVVWWNFLCRWRTRSQCFWFTNQPAPGPHQHQCGHCELAQEEADCPSGP